jgi:amino acid permease
MLLVTVQALGELAVLFPVNGAFFTYVVRFVDPSLCVHSLTLLLDYMSADESITAALQLDGTTQSAGLPFFHSSKSDSRFPFSLLWTILRVTRMSST